MIPEAMVAAGAALWLGILTSASPCPLATNIAAISWLTKGIGSPRLVFSAGLLYAAGRAAAYVGIAAAVVASLMSIPQLSQALQSHINKWLGLVLILVGMFLLGLLDFRFAGGISTASLENRFSGMGLWGAALMGILFALSFCPVSAALFFGSLIPLAIRQESAMVLPALYGAGTGLPVIVFAWLLAAGARSLGKAFDRLAQVERYARLATGGVFVAAGIYMALVHIYGVTV
jgi:cytochrome c-type biogenesis protein